MRKQFFKTNIERTVNHRLFEFMNQRENMNGFECSDGFVTMLVCESSNRIACSKDDVRKQLICDTVKPTNRKRFDSDWESEREGNSCVLWLEWIYCGHLRKFTI